MTTIGVLAFQGDVSEHLEMIRSVGAKPTPIRRPYELEVVDALILPGGESTTAGLLLKQTGLDVALQKRIKEGMPVWGTCMGMILLAKKLVNTDQWTLGVMNISARRNAFGRQRESFEEEISISVLKDKAFPCVFIRSPWIEEVGPGVQVLAALQGKPVLVREGNLMASTFHPEIAKDMRLHQYFLGMVREHGLTN